MAKHVGCILSINPGVNIIGLFNQESGTTALGAQTVILCSPQFLGAEWGMQERWSKEKNVDLTGVSAKTECA